MNKKMFAFTVTFVLLFSTAIVAIVVKGNTTDSIDDSGYCIPEYEIQFTDRNVYVFSDDGFLSEVKNDLSKATSNVCSLSDFEDVKTEDIIIVDVSQVYKNDIEKISDEIKSVIYNNIPAIFMGNDLYMLMEHVIDPNTRSYSGDENIYCICIHDKRIPYSYGITSSDTAGSLLDAYSWADAVLSDDPYDAIWNFSWYTHNIDDYKSVLSSNSNAQATESVSGPHWETVLVSTKSKEFSPYGNLSVNVDVQKLMDYNDDHSYFKYHYCQFGEPNYSEDYRLADIYARNMQGQPVLFDHGPTTTSGVNIVSVSLGINAGTSGASGNGLADWSYSMNDVTLINTSQIGAQTVNFWHDVREDRDIGMGYIAEPGVIMKIPSIANICYTGLYHEVQFCKKVPHQIQIGGSSIASGYDYADYEKFGFNWMVAVG